MGKKYDLFGRPLQRQRHRWENVRVRGAFDSGNVDRLLSGWDTTSSTIDYYLGGELRQMRARSRAMVRMNPYGKRFITTIKSNVVGPAGVSIQAQVMRQRGEALELDSFANDAIEAGLKDWGCYHCDYLGKLTWVDMQNLAIATAGQDGEFLFQVYRGKGAGKYGYQLKVIDPELLNVEKNTKTKNGEIRLGVEYDRTGRVIRYHFKRINQGGQYLSGYDSGDYYSLPANQVIHGFIPEWPDQSRGVPWMHSSLERSKHLEKYDEAAVVNARGGAGAMAFLTGDPANRYEGDGDDYMDATLDHFEPGTIKDIGDRQLAQFDPNYPHQMYADFVKAQLRGIAAGLGISYHSLSNDLEGVNYSSIRAGVLEDREIFKGLQNWFIRTLVQPVYEDWLYHAWSAGAIRIGSTPLSMNRNPVEYMPAHYQARRWAWVDPQKDSAANQMALEARTKSRSQIMREAGDDPESVWREIAREEEIMARLGISPAAVTMPEEAPPDE